MRMTHCSNSVIIFSTSVPCVRCAKHVLKMRRIWIQKWENFLQNLYCYPTLLPCMTCGQWVNVIKSINKSVSEHIRCVSVLYTAISGIWLAKHREPGSQKLSQTFSNRGYAGAIVRIIINYHSALPPFQCVTDKPEKLMLFADATVRTSLHPLHAW